MRVFSEQYAHFALPSNATMVLLDRPQSAHFQFRKVCSITIRFLAETGCGHSLGGWILSVRGIGRSPYHTSGVALWFSKIIAGPTRKRGPFQSFERRRETRFCVRLVSNPTDLTGPTLSGTCR